MGRGGVIDDDRTLIASVPTELFVGGEWRAGSGGRFAVEDPSTGAVLCEVADASADDGIAALAAAHEGASGWAATAPRARAEILRRAYEGVVARSEELAGIITLEMGKPLAQSREEVAYGAEFLRWYSEEAVRVHGRFGVSPSGDGRLLTMLQPVGPCLFITPWNFPLAMGTRKIAPALAAGCTVVVKPAQQTPLAMLALARILAEAGLPDGVVNVVPTSDAAGVTAPILRDRRLRKLSFTGSTQVGRRLIAAAADNVLRVSMELGGNAPFIVFADADVDAAVEGALVAKLRNMGEACTAANRFYVHESVREAFTASLAARMAAMRLGRGTEDGVEIGPLIDARARDGVHALVSDAVERGATVRTGGAAPDGAGYFYAPTVLDGVDAGARMLHEEIFGPVAPVSEFATEDEAVAAANDTEYGLVAYVYTNDLRRAVRVVERLEVGMVGVNAGKVSNAAAPFGGVKQSGFGREGGVEGMAEYLEPKYVNLPV